MANEKFHLISRKFITISGMKMIRWRYGG